MSSPWQTSTHWADALWEDSSRQPTDVILQFCSVEAARPPPHPPPNKNQDVLHGSRCNLNKAWLSVNPPKHARACLFRGRPKWISVVLFGFHLKPLKRVQTKGTLPKIDTPTILWMGEILHHPRNPRMMIPLVKYQQTMVCSGAKWISSI